MQVHEYALKKTRRHVRCMQVKQPDVAGLLLHGACATMLSVCQRICFACRARGTTVERDSYIRSRREALRFRGLILGPPSSSERAHLSCAHIVVGPLLGPERNAGMLSGGVQPRILLGSLVTFLCLHALTLFVFHANTTVATYPFLILAPVAALAGCLWQARLTSSRARLRWMLISAGILLWVVDMLLSAREELLQVIPGTITENSDFAFFLYGAPLLLAISSPTEGTRSRLFFWLDVLQAVLTAFLTYVTLFSVVPFASTKIEPISVSLLMTTYNIENLVLAGGASLRLLAQPLDGEDRRAFKVLCWFLWLYAACACLYNYESVSTQQHALFDLLVDVPFISLAVLTLRAPAIRQDKSKIDHQTALGRFIEIASPIFYTLALLGLGIATLRNHFHIGICAITVAFIVYGVRTTVLQSRFLWSQRALQDARDRLKEMSLKDSLTDIANRRCFDEMLEAEWHRAARSQQPLSFLLADVDLFKNLNDRYGHRRGDECLTEIAKAMKAALPRSGDALARYGGEEFAVILPDTDRAGARKVAARMQQAVGDLKLVNKTELGDHVTLSVGVATYQFPEPGTAADLIDASDRALYRAKAQGRNRIEPGALNEIVEPV
jgi:diguanylate cyclase (GGDEF)-like protein